LGREMSRGLVFTWVQCCAIAIDEGSTGCQRRDCPCGGYAKFYTCILARVPAHVLVTVLSLLPRQGEQTVSVSLRLLILPWPYGCKLASSALEATTRSLLLRLGAS